MSFYFFILLKMKKIYGLLILWSVTLFSACQFNSSYSSISSTKNTSSLNCFQENYYENLEWKQKIPFVWNNDENAYEVTIPELCVKFSLARVDESFKWDLSRWKEKDPQKNPLLYAEREGNRVLFDNGNVQYIIKNKKKEETLDEAIDGVFWIHNNAMLDKKYCNIIKNTHSYNELSMNGWANPKIEWEKNAQYLLETPYLVAKNMNISDNEAYSQICGLSYPVEDIWFGRIVPYGVLYTDNNPEVYVLYNNNVAQDIHTPFTDVTITL